MRFIVLDIETANYSPESICQIGIVVLDDFKIVFMIGMCNNKFIYSFLISSYKRFV